MSNINSYVVSASHEQVGRLRGILEARGWKFSSVQYAYWRATMEKMNVTAYLSGKLMVQGAGTADFVQFTLEPEILGTFTFGYEAELAEAEDPRMFEPHAGIDESGKGDYFGTLVVACCYTDEAMARALLKAGVTDSKKITTSKKIFELEAEIKKVTGGRYSLVILPPETYNRVYASVKNLNRLLGWGHAKVLEDLLMRVPDCPRAISDQFGRKESVQNALQERGRKIELEQHPKAEADVAVAAASVLARAEFVRRIESMGKKYEMEFPKGASGAVKQTARKFVKKYGADALGQVAKLHFKTTEEVLRGGQQTFF